MIAPVADDIPAAPGQAGIGDFLRRSGLLPPGYDPVMVPLTGGVASDIWRVDGPHGSLVVKRALAQLRVAQVWAAPVSAQRERGVVDEGGRPDRARGRAERAGP